MVMFQVWVSFMVKAIPMLRFSVRSRATFRVSVSIKIKARAGVMF